MRSTLRQPLIKPESSSESYLAINEAKLSSKNLFSEKPYSKVESCAYCYMNLCSCICDLKLKKAVNENRFVYNDPIIAFRADSRSPVEIFEEGFSAYSPKRFIFCRPPLCSALLCCPFYCIWAVCFQEAGQSLYSKPFVSQLKVVTFTLDYKFAYSYFANEPKQWRYIVYLDGCIMFCDFSHDLITKGASDPRGGITIDAREVFPRDPNNQRVPASRVIAAVACDFTKRKEFKNPGKSALTFIFNKKFGAWNDIASELNKLGMDAGRKFPSINLKLTELMTLLETTLGKKLYLPKMKSEGPAQQSMSL